MRIVEIEYTPRLGLFALPLKLYEHYNFIIFIKIVYALCTCITLHCYTLPPVNLTEDLGYYVHFVISLLFHATIKYYVYTG